MDFTALIKELGIDQLPEDQQQRIMVSALKTVQTNVSTRLGELLTKQQLQGVANAMERGEQEGFAELLRVYPDYYKLYQEEVDTLKEDMKPSHE